MTGGGAKRLGVLAMALALALASCARSTGAELGRRTVPEPGHLRWCIGEPDSLDPATLLLAESIAPMLLLWDAPILIGRDLELEPGLATRWESSPDLRTFTLHLRTDGRFSNGRPITAEDLRYSLVRALDPRTASPFAETLWRVRKGRVFGAGKLRRVTEDAPPFVKGDAVELLPETPAAPDPDRRTARHVLELRAWPDRESALFETLAAGATVELVERRGERAYVFRGGGEGRFGWVDSDELEIPDAGVLHAVRALDDGGPSPRTGRVPARALEPAPDLVGIRAPDDETLVLETDAPTPFMLTSVAFEAPSQIVDREIVSRYPRSWTRPEHIVTSGPFHVAAWRDRDRLELVRSPTYRARDGVRLDRITLFVGETVGPHLERYIYGACDGIDSVVIPPASLPLFFDASGRATRRDVVPRPNRAASFLVLHTKRLPDVHLRRALAAALDLGELPKVAPWIRPTGQLMPGKLVKELRPDERALCGVDADRPGVVSIVEPGRLCYVPPLPEPFEPARARRELELAHQAGAEIPRPLVLGTRSTLSAVRFSEWVAERWHRVLGLDVEIRAEEGRVYFADLPRGAFHAGLSGIGDVNPDPEALYVPMMRAGNPLDEAAFDDAEYEGLLRDAASLVDRRARLDVIARAEAMLLAKAPIVPLGMRAWDFVLARPFVKGVALDMSNAWIDAGANETDDEPRAASTEETEVAP